MWVMFAGIVLWRMVLEEDQCFGGQSTGCGGSHQSVGVKDSPGRVALKIFSHFVIQQICLPLIRASYGQDRVLVTFKQCQLRHTVFFFINFNSVDI